MNYRVAIIGAGRWSQNHLAGWRAQPGVEVRWLVRSTEEAARQRAETWGVPHWSADYKAVLAREDIDIADIVLPHDLHAEVACLALAQGKDVVLEKPLAPTLLEARRIAETARRYNRKVMISENWIYSTMVQNAHAVLAKGEIGTPFLTRTSLDLDARANLSESKWCMDHARMGGGALLDAGTHPVSVCRYLLGEICDVSAVVSTQVFPEIKPMEDTAVMLMRFTSGASGVLTTTYVARRERPKSEFIILGTEGAIEFDTHVRQFFVTRDGKRSEQFVMQASRGFAEQMEHFVQCLRENRDPITSPDEQIGSLKVVLAAYRSAASGRSVRVAEIEA